MVTNRRRSFVQGEHDVKPTRKINLPLRQTANPATPTRSMPLESASPQLNNMGTRAAALAEMTRALHIRHLQQKVNDLERDIEKLCQRTEEDEAYRAKNEEKLAAIFREVVVVKTQAGRVEGHPEVTVESVKKETDAITEAFRAQLNEQRTLVREAQETMATLPDKDQIQRLITMAQGLGPQYEVSQDFGEKQGQEPGNLKIKIDPDIEQRIEETIASTKRWNAEHETTEFEDSIFVKNYLNKQASRDMQMAKLIQRTLTRTLAQRGVTSPSRTLADFCNHLSWRDVIDTVQVLVDDQREVTARKLTAGAK